MAFVQEIWDRIADSPECVPVPGAHRRIRDQRLAEFRTDPQAGHGLRFANACWQ